MINYEAKNNSLQKKKIQNISHKQKKNLGTDIKPKTIRHETEKKPLTTKFNLNEENNINSKQNNKKNSSINTNVNIINININNNNTHNIKNQSISDKEISLIIKQKLKEINDIKSKNEEKKFPKNKGKTKYSKIIDNSFKASKGEEDELKALLNPLYLKDLSITNNQSNTITNILNNTNNSNLFSSIFQESQPNKTKTFIGMPENYSLKTENNVNSNVSRPKSSLFQYLGNDIEKYMLMHGENSINVINYIAKKLVATSFCGSFNFQSGYTSSCSNSINNNINQTISFLKNNSDSNNSLGKANNNDENKVDNSFENNSLSKDTSLFINDENNNDDKDLNFKNLVSILNKKFKSYLSKEKLNKTEISKKNNNKNNKNKKNNVINIEQNKSIHNTSKEEKKNNLFSSFSTHINTKNNKTENNNNNSYLVFSYSKNKKINQAGLKHKDSIQEKNKKYKNDLKGSINNLPPSKIYSYNSNNTQSNYNTFLDISTTYDPGIDSRNSSIERSNSIKKNELRNFSCSPSHNHKKEKNFGSKKKILNNNTTYMYNYANNKIMNLTKGNRNFNIISEDDEYKDIENKKFNNSKTKKIKKYHQVCQNKVTINLSLNEEGSINNSNNNISRKKNTSKIKARVIKKK